MSTRFFHAQDGLPGGRLGVDNAFAEQHEQGFGAEIMGADVPHRAASPT